MDQKINRLFYSPILNDEEYEKICNVDNAEKYLLKLRADTIVDHMRLFRVYRNKANIKEGSWSLEQSFYTKPYEMFLSSINNKMRDKCSSIVYGNIFSNDPNGYIFNTEFGPIITISESLMFFCKFMNLALLEYSTQVPQHVCKNAIRIAIRVMLKTEALDFFMDPRGIVPEDVGIGMHLPIDYQLMSIIGHEYAHYLLGHLDKAKSSIRPVFFAISEKDTDYMEIKVYSQSQQQELDADLMSLELPQLNEEEYKKLFDSTLLWFASLELYEAAIEVMWPSNPWNPSTHPTARERMDNILKNSKKPYDYSYKETENLKATIEIYKEWIVDDVSINMDFYEMYGSAYLDQPDSEWRGKELIDRVDYY